MNDPISSPQNALVKRAASLHQRKYREREGAFLVEGADLVLAGLAAGRRPAAVFVTAGSAAHESVSRDPLLRAATVYPVAGQVARKITALETPPDMMAIFALPEAPPLAALAAPDTLVVFADAIGDPGNMGTLMRAAAAFGAAALVASPRSVDLYSPKCVRASVGAVFGLALYPETPLADLIVELPEATVFGLAAHGGAVIGAAELRRPAIICIGAERAGLSADTAGAVDELVTIPLAPVGAGAVESLNAGVAGAIALYEFARRTSGTTTAGNES